MITSLSIRNFDYELPDSAVAKYPLPERDQSKLLLWKDHAIEDHLFGELPVLLPEGSMLVFNNTRVIRARLNFIKSTGARIEIFCLEPTLPVDYAVSFSQTFTCRWKCIVGNLKRWKGEKLEMKMENGDRRPETGKGRTENGEYREMEEAIRGERGARMVVLTAALIGELDGGFEVQFSWDNPEYTFSEILEAAGNIPIPPYLHRESEEIDSTVYQTVYSKIKGSVAAPTAGLHFTEKIFKELSDRGISCQELTLHVGAGTFQPVKSSTIGEHRMHTEHFSVSLGMIDQLVAHQGKVVAVGTTSVRTLESLYWIGCKIIQNPLIEPDQLAVEQWEPYEEEILNSGAKEALLAISTYLSGRGMKSLETSTQIMVLPGYQFRIIDGLVTNFHQPQSTLLLLISAILGDDWKRVYTHALNSGYRFLSYGDANLYWI
jgi:S-adenosylmethionine:tRNA ribosyltransferase-isomerase